MNTHRGTFSSTLKKATRNPHNSLQRTCRYAAAMKHKAILMWARHHFSGRICQSRREPDHGKIVGAPSPKVARLQKLLKKMLWLDPNLSFEQPKGAYGSSSNAPWQLPGSSVATAGQPQVYRSTPTTTCVTPQRTTGPPSNCGSPHVHESTNGHAKCSAPSTKSRALPRAECRLNSPG